MPLGFHLVIGAYGFWLPNDPRGSWSTFVGSCDLLQYGPATKTSETRSAAHVPHDHALRMEAKQSLKYPAVVFTGVQARAIGRGFAAYIERTGLKVWACAILPNHVHLVTAGTALKPESVAVQLKGEATRRLESEEIHPLAQYKSVGARPPKCWARGEWVVYLNTEEAVDEAIRYVEENPAKAGLKSQHWSFISKHR